jgi:hypothetical protein
MVSISLKKCTSTDKQVMTDKRKINMKIRNQYTMKNIVKKLVTSLALVMFIGLGSFVAAQPGPPPPPSGHGTDGNQAPGGGAPIGSGLVIMITMGAAYGAKKIFDARKRLEE